MYRSQLHDSPIRCLALDPHEEFFVTGAADGDIKVPIDFLIEPSYSKKVYVDIDLFWEDYSFWFLGRSFTFCENYNFQSFSK